MDDQRYALLNPASRLRGDDGFFTDVGIFRMSASLGCSRYARGYGKEPRARLKSFPARPRTTPETRPEPPFRQQA